MSEGEALVFLSIQALSLIYAVANNALVTACHTQHNASRFSLGSRPLVAVDQRSC